MAVVVSVLEKEGEIDDVSVLDLVEIPVLLRVWVRVLTPVPNPDTVIVPDNVGVCVPVLV